MIEKKLTVYCPDLSQNGHRLATAEVSEKAREVMDADGKIGNGRESVSDNNKENR